MTVRLRVTALAAFAVLTVLALAGVGLVVAERILLTRNLDDALQVRADSIAAQTDRPALGDLGDDDLFAQVIRDGVVINATSNLAGAPALGGTGVRTMTDVPADDGSFRVVTRQVDGTVVHVGGALDDVDESVSTLTTILLVAVPALTAVLAALVWTLVGRTLAPVEAIRSEVAAIGGDDLHRRVPEPASRDEIARLARTMNAMLDRVEEAAERQQRFVADASHELRSPLTRIRSELEVDLAHPGTSDPLTTHRSVLAEAVALQRLVDDLLELARGRDGHKNPVDLDDLVLAEARDARQHGLTVDTAGVSAAQVMGDAGQLGRAVRNLVDNAARHAHRTVTLTLAEKDGHAVLAVADDGPGIPPHEHERVFERFARLDEARADGGAGLGLAITREIVERHGGTVRIDPDHRPGTRLVVRLPH
jgi:signal transduction histidine kinase